MEIAILQFIKAKGVGFKAIRRFCTFMRQNRMDVDELRTHHDARLLVDQIGIKACYAEAIVMARDDALRDWEKLRENNVQMLWIGSESYPSDFEDMLGESAPPYLFVKGNVEILKKDCVGVCGSRHASQRGLALAKDIASELAHNGIGIVSGNASGVDIVSHEATLRNGGVTIFVLPIGILNYRARRETELLLSNENHLIVSQFPPETMWFAHNAMTRNSLIVALSKTMLVVEAGRSGGTLAAGEKALELGQPLFAIQYADAPSTALGNDILVRNGAVPIRKGRDGAPNLDTLIKRVKQNETWAKRDCCVQSLLF